MRTVAETFCPCQLVRSTPNVHTVHDTILSLHCTHANILLLYKTVIRFTRSGQAWLKYIAVADCWVKIGMGDRTYRVINFPPTSIPSLTSWHHWNAFAASQTTHTCAEISSVFVAAAQYNHCYYASICIKLCVDLHLLKYAWHRF